jgi:hypothetical protein
MAFKKEQGRMLASIQNMIPQAMGGVWNPVSGLAFADLASLFESGPGVL